MKQGAGQYRHRVTFDSPAVSQGASGEELIAWALFGTFWTALEPLNGNEQLQAGQMLNVVDTRIRMRWSPNADQITDKWRARHNGIIYNIKSVIHVNFAQRELHIMCTSGKNAGG